MRRGLALLILVLTDPAAGADFRVERVATGLALPVYAVSPPDESERVFVLEQHEGRIRIVRPLQKTVDPVPFLDLADVATDNEQGLLGLAFHPDYANNGRFYVNYTNTAGDTRVVEYQASSDPNRADACARLAVLHDKQGKFPESAQWYERALALRPNDPDILADRGYSRYLQQQWQLAENDLRQALWLKPDHRRAHNNLGLVLARAGRVDDALASFRQAGCRESEARANLAYALTLRGRLSKASDPASPGVIVPVSAGGSRPKSFESR